MAFKGSFFFKSWQKFRTEIIFHNDFQQKNSYFLMLSKLSNYIKQDFFAYFLHGRQF